MRNLTALGLIVAAAEKRTRLPDLEKPPLSQLPGVAALLPGKHINPTKMRKGKSGELPRGR